MNTKAKTPSRCGQTDADAEQSSAIVARIDELLIKSMPAFNHHMDAFERSINPHFSATGHDSNTFENKMKTLLRIEYIALICLIGTLLLGFAGLIYAILMRSHTS